MLRIGADTAFFGAPIEKYMEDRQNLFRRLLFVLHRCRTRLQLDRRGRWKGGRFPGRLPGFKSQGRALYKKCPAGAAEVLDPRKVSFRSLDEGLPPPVSGSRLSPRSTTRGFQHLPRPSSYQSGCGFPRPRHRPEVDDRLSGPASPLERCRRAPDDHQHEPGSLSFIRERGFPSARCPPDPHVGGNNGGICGEPLLRIDTPQQRGFWRKQVSQSETSETLVFLFDDQLIPVADNRSVVDDHWMSVRSFRSSSRLPDMTSTSAILPASSVPPSSSMPKTWAAFWVAASIICIEDVFMNAYSLDGRLLDPPVELSEFHKNDRLPSRQGTLMIIK